MKNQHRTERDRAFKLTDTGIGGSSRMAHLTNKELLEMASGDMSQSARATADAHAGQCPQCRARLAELRQTWELLGQWRLPAHAPDLSGRIVRQAANDAAGRRQPQLLGRLLAKAAAAVLVAAAAGYGLGRAFRPEPQAGSLQGPGRTEESDVVRTLDLHAIGSSPVGLADSLPGLHTNTQEIHE